MKKNPVKTEQMKTYIGTKVINARPCTAVEAEVILNRQINTENADADVNGYLVRYKDGYTSWSPAKAFEEAYRPVDNDAPVQLFSNEAEVCADALKRVSELIESAGFRVLTVSGGIDLSQVDLPNGLIQEGLQPGNYTWLSLRVSVPNGTAKSRPTVDARYSESVSVRCNHA